MLTASRVLEFTQAKSSFLCLARVGLHVKSHKVEVFRAIMKLCAIRDFRLENALGINALKRLVTSS